MYYVLGPLLFYIHYVIKSFMRLILVQFTDESISEQLIDYPIESGQKIRTV